MEELLLSDIDCAWHKQIEMHTAEPLVSEPSSVEVRIAIKNQKRCNSSGIDQITVELFQARVNILYSEIHKLLIPFGIRRTTTAVEVIYYCTCYKMDDENYINYRGTSLLPATYKILSNIRLTLYVDKIIGDYQCEFRCNGSTTHHIYCIRQVLVKKWEYN
jgi:hypothetical protein